MCFAGGCTSREVAPLSPTLPSLTGPGASLTLSVRPAHGGGPWPSSLQCKLGEPLRFRQVERYLCTSVPPYLRTSVLP